MFSGSSRTNPTSGYRGRFLAQEDVRYKSAGTLNLRREIISLFSTLEKKTVRIKNLDIIVTSFYNDFGAIPHYCDAIASLRTSESPGLPKIKCHVIETERNNEYVRKDLHHILTPATELLQAEVAKRGFNGLSVPVLKSLANTFRAIPREGGLMAAVQKKREPAAKSKKITSRKK